MSNIKREVGQVKIVQLQPNGLFIDDEKTATGYFYDPSRLVEVQQLTITPLGIETITPDGERVLDIHHISHPDKEYDDDDLVSIGFTSHYVRMRENFGEHLIDGIAGENIIVAFDEEIWLNDLGGKIGLKNQDTGTITTFQMQSQADPCREFSSFALGSQYEKHPAATLKKALQFLGNGRRGFLFVMDEGQEPANVRVGDKLLVLEVD